MDGSRQQTRVKRRRVFYIPGYDPLPPRRYREIYRKEAARQAAVSGHVIAISPGRDPEHYGWHVQAEIEGVPVVTDVEVMVWSDIVRRSMDVSIAGTYLLLARTAWIYASTGALGRLLRLRKGPVIAAFYPVAMLLGQGLAAGLAGWGGGALVGALLHPLAGWAVGIALAIALLRWFRRLDGRLYAHYLLHDYAFCARHRGANPPEIEERLARFRARIAQALESREVDEVLVVGHSSGAHLAVNIVADILREGRARPNGPALSLLTLGQVVPMVSFLPRAGRLRADLRLLSTSERIAWVDVSAPGDGACFALCDPVAVSGVAPEQGQRWPLVISAAFSRTLSPARWRALRWRFFRLHFQYIHAFDRPGDYDYFRITAGPLTLGARYAGRRSSKSRIDTPLSPHRSMAA